MGRYRSLSGTLIDPEKQRHSNDYDSDEVPSLVSSRDTSRSYAPMLAQQSHSKHASLAYHLPRRRFSRYFTLAISAVLLFFITYLVRSSWASRAEIRFGNRRPFASPPAWEQFPFLKRYHGGIRTLVSRSENVPEYPADPDVEVQRLNDEAMRQKQNQDAQTARQKGFQRRQAVPGSTSRFDPYPSYSSTGDRNNFEPPVKCHVNNQTKTEIPKLLTYNGVPKGFPDPVMGSHELFGLRDDVCFERYGRLGPYGFGYSKKYGGSGAGLDGENEGSGQVWADQMEVNYDKVRWADLQSQCIKANAGRFKDVSSSSADHFYFPTQPQVDSEESRKSSTVNGKQFLNRTAVLIRTWNDYQYDNEDLFYLRALVNELSLQSGAEYSVYFLIHVKDDNRQIWADREVYQRTVDEALPEEFRGMGILWSERQMGLVYGGVAESMYRNLPVHGVYRSTYMPMQYFAHMHPEFDFFWHWEMDIRYTGHFYHLFHQISEWAKKQPRKGLWERNGRFYVPKEHGSWEDFRQMVRVQTEHGTATKGSIYDKLAAEAGTTNPMDANSRRPETPIWGPMRPSGEGDQTDNPEQDPIPPTSYEKDNYEWGVGEDADFITFNPLFDPRGTNWILAEDVTGYDTAQGYPPRRTAIITASRLSRRLLDTMHRETALQRHTMFSEMWPGSCALHHGYKAVYAPHPVYIDRAWPTSYLAAIFNNGRNGAAGGSRTSVFSDERQHNFRGTTWYYDAGFSPNLWKRWLGYRVDGDGGEEEEVAGEGRMCLPAMLLHPVKQVDLVYEHLAEVGS